MQTNEGHLGRPIYRISCISMISHEYDFWLYSLILEVIAHLPIICMPQQHCFTTDDPYSYFPTIYLTQQWVCLPFSQRFTLPFIVIHLTFFIGALAKYPSRQNFAGWRFGKFVVFHLLGFIIIKNPNWFIFFRWLNHQADSHRTIFTIIYIYIYTLVMSLW